jgi:hypothetical protein
MDENEGIEDTEDITKYDNPMYRAVLVGEEQYAKGQYRRYTPEVFEEIKRNAAEKLRRGHKPNPEVVPYGWELDL